MSNSIFNELKKVNEVDAIGGTIKSLIDDTIVFVDATGNKNIVSMVTMTQIVPSRRLQ